MTFTATVSSSNGAPAGGTVTFTIDGTPGAPIALSGGTAAFSTSTLSVGDHPVSAEYSGETYFTGSTSVAITQTVVKGRTTTTVDATPLVVMPGQDVDLTAEVETVLPATGTPTGDVIFRQGPTILGTIPLVSGEATLQTSDLRIGRPIVTARYVGTSTLLGSAGTVSILVDPRLGPEFLVNTRTLNTQHRQSVARLTNNRFVVTWQSDAPPSLGWDVYAQRYAASGAKDGGEFLVNTNTANNHFAPVSTGFANGGFVVVWQHGSPGLPARIRAQRYDNLGQKAGGEIVVSRTNGGSQPSVAALGSGYVVAVVSEGSPKAIYVRRYDAAGGFIGDFSVTNQPALVYSNPSITGLSDGFVVTWLQPAIGGYDVYGRRYQAGVGGAEFKINTQVAGEFRPAITRMQDGGFIVAWEASDADGAGIYARRYTSAGVAGGVFAVNTTSAGDQTQPSISGFVNGGFVLTWTSQNQDGSARGVYAQVFDSAGVRKNVEFRVNRTVADHQLRSSVATLGDDTFVGTWTSHNQDGSLLGVYGQRFGEF